MVAIVRRNPSRALTVVEPGYTYFRPLSIVDEVEMLARDFWDTWEPFTSSTEGLPLDMYEYKDELVMNVELPGFNREDIDISLEGNLLTIKAEKQQADVPEDATHYFCELCYGSYSRSVSLPFPVDATKISTSLDNGVLTIKLSKAAEAKAKHIEIKVGSIPKAISSKSK